MTFVIKACNVVFMNWEPLKPKRGTSWNRNDGYELRLTNRNIGYLNANAREFLFDGKRAGMVSFDIDEDDNMSVIAASHGLKVSASGHLAVSTVTAQTTAPLPITVLLIADDAEKRLVFAGVRK